MKTKLSQNNPFNCSRYAYVFEQLPLEGNCLDYGCYDGFFIKQVCTVKTHLNYIGLDKNKDIVQKNPHNINLKFINKHIPIKNDSIDVITILDVLEHIHDQDSLLKNFHKILHQNGKLIITVPKQNLFSFLDLGNLKFRFPRLHQLFYTMRYSRKAYDERYVNNPNGLIGDVEKEKAWHQHFRVSELEFLLNTNGFEITEIDGSGKFERVILLFDLLKLGFLIPLTIRQDDCKKYESMNLFCTAVKCKD